MRVLCNGLFLRGKNAPLFFAKCINFFSPFFSLLPKKRLYVFRVLEFFFLWPGVVCKSSLSLDTQKKTLLSQSRLFIHFRSLFLFAFKTTFYARSCSLAQKRESLLPKKKRNTKNTRKVVLFWLFFRRRCARVSKTKERERDGELFLRRERERSRVHLGS